MTFDVLVTRIGASAVSVKDYAYVADWDGLWSGPPFRGQDPLVPSRRGLVWSAQEYDAYTFSVALEVIGTSQANFQDRLANLRALLESSMESVTVTRKHPIGSGDLSTSCRSRCRLSEVGARSGLFAARVALEVTNLDGCWYGAALTPTIPATITSPGTARTNRITLMLPGAGTLTNTTLGVSVTVTASATLTVQTKTTTGTLADVVAAGDPFNNWFAVDPGANLITWSGGGTPTISYAPAYS